MVLQANVLVVDHSVVNDPRVDGEPSDSDVSAEEVLARLERLVRDASSGWGRSHSACDGGSADILPRQRRYLVGQSRRTKQKCPGRARRCSDLGPVLS